MPLQGTFDVLDFSEVLRLLARQELTGRLHVRSRSFAANMFFEEGSLVGADQSEHQAAAAAGDVRGRVEEICFEMLDAERGAFEFQPGRPSSLPPPVKLGVDTVLSRARKRLQEWQELQDAIPSLELQPRLVDDLGNQEVTLDQERWKFLTSVDGRKSLRAIGRALNLSDFEVCRLTKVLIEDGLVELDARAAALASAARDAVVPTVPTPDTPAVRESVKVTERAAKGAGDGPSGQAPEAPAGEASAGRAGAAPQGDEASGEVAEAAGGPGGDAPAPAAGDSDASPANPAGHAGPVTGDAGDAGETGEAGEGEGHEGADGQGSAARGRRRLVRIRSRTDRSDAG